MRKAREQYCEMLWNRIETALDKPLWEAVTSNIRAPLWRGDYLTENLEHAVQNAIKEMYEG